MADPYWCFISKKDRNMRNLTLKFQQVYRNILDTYCKNTEQDLYKQCHNSQIISNSDSCCVSQHNF